VAEQHHGDDNNDGAGELRQWLDSVGAGDHAAAFAEQGFDTVGSVLAAGLSESDLRELGIGMKARKAIVNGLLSGGGPPPAAAAGPDAGAGADAPPSRFAAELWDSFGTVLSDVRAQAAVCGAVSRYVQGRCQLEADYSKRLQTLTELLAVPEGESVLLRQYGPLFEVVAASARAAAERHADCAAELRETGGAALTALTQRQAAEVDQLSSEAARLRLHLKQAHSNLERDQTAYILAQHAAAAQIGRGDAELAQEVASAEAA